MSADDPAGRSTASDLAHRRLALFDLVQDIRIGLNLAFYRTFAVPGIAELLVRTGEIGRQPHKRSVDTGLFMYELIEAGFDSERGRGVVRGLNRMHRRWAISAEDYLYVLTTFVVVPTRWTNRFGARRLTDRDIQVTVDFYRELGRLMGIAGMPDTYAEVAAVFDAYEAEHIGFSPAGRTLMHQTRGVLADQLPWIARPAAALLTGTVLEDYVAEAVGVRPAPPAARHALAAVTVGRRFAYRLTAVRRRSYFVPGRAVNGVYPRGYRFDELGVPAPPTRPPTIDTRTATSPRSSGDRAPDS